MARLNRLAIIGRLGRDAELRTVGSGTQVLSMSVAVDSWKKENPPTWVAVSVWDKRAEALGRLELAKGTLVYVVGEASVRGYEKRDGTVGASLELRALDVQLLSSRGERSQQPADHKHRTIGAGDWNQAPLPDPGDGFDDDVIPF